MKTTDSTDHHRELYRFTERLHMPPSDTEPRGMPDWQRAPPLFRPVPGMSVLRLPSVSESCSKVGEDPLAILGKLLWFAYGCATVRNTPAGIKVGSPSGVLRVPSLTLLAARPVASGGGSYPADISMRFGSEWESYMPGISRSVYRYGPQYHALFSVVSPMAEQGGPGHPTCKARGLNIELIVSVVFLRTWFKYRDFSYRLTAVDTGVLLGRLVSLSDSLGLNLGISLNLDEGAYDRLTQLDPDHASSYAVLTLHLPTPRPASALAPPDANKMMGRAPSTGPLPAVLPFSEPLRAMRLAAARSHKISGEPVSRDAPAPPSSPWAFPLLKEAIRFRQSSAESFTGASLPLSLLATALKTTDTCMREFLARSDVPNLATPQLYCTIMHVDGVQPGVYRYVHGSDKLSLIRVGDFAEAAQRAQYLGNVEIKKCSFIVHPAACGDWRTHPIGPRLYRIIQMLVGVGLDNLMLSVSGPGRSGHAFLGFAADTIDKLYELDSREERCMAQVCVGRTRRGFQINTPVIT